MTLENSLQSWLSSAKTRIQEGGPEPEITHVGSVERVGDGVAKVVGLPQVRMGELVRFEDGTLGLAILVQEQTVGCILFSSGEGIRAGDRAYCTGNIARVPVGPALLGRIVDPLGAPLDAGPAIEAERFDPVERPAPRIIDRDFVTQPLLTGLTVIDAMIPLGRGQRELLIGDRKTGKTSVAVDTIISQRDTGVVCVYCAIGQKASSISRAIEAIREHGNADNCVFVVGGADAAPGAQWIAPYAACTIAEYFRDLGQDALIVFDDLTKHAIVYRELSLLLRKPPGREAYPGDVFYLHARLLERAAKLSPALGGGSLTALPIAETQAGNMTAYIPTNLISITDGQVYLEPKLFYEGQKPAVNVGLSVSRVGGKTQAPAINALAERLKLEYAQFLELEVFTRFGALVDDRTAKQIAHGRRIRAVLQQKEHAPIPLAVQVATLIALSEGRLDGVDLAEIPRFRSQLAERLPKECAHAADRVQQTMELNDEDRADMLTVIDRLVAEVTAAAAAEHSQ